MTCENYLELLSSYLDNALSLEEQSVLEAHLKACSKCQEELDNLKWITSCLDTVEDRPLPKDFHEKLMRKVNEEKKPKGNRNKFFAVASSIAAVMILAVAFIDQDPQTIVPQQMSMGEPEIASYSMERSMENASTEAVVEQSKQGRNVASDTPVVGNKMDRAIAPMAVLEDTWHITCEDTKELSRAIEKISEANDYKVQTIIQDTTIQMTFTESVDREILKSSIEETEGIEEFLIEEFQNNQLTLIIMEFTP
ncbi:MAG: zf-HC2 domain-containing protein [Cellulosilyticaceae bacterium]